MSDPRNTDVLSAPAEGVESLTDAEIAGEGRVIVTGKNKKYVNIAIAILAVAAVGLFALLIFGRLDKLAAGSLVIVLMLMLLALRLPIALAMLLPGAAGLYAFGGSSMVVGSLGAIVHGSVSSWSLSVVPLFVFMGVAMWRGGLTAPAYAAAQAWLGKLPGGLAIGTNFAGAGLAASSGSTVGISYALGKMAIPEMMKAGYSPAVATGSVAMAGTLGQLIPPSIMLVIFAGIVEVPVGPQLIAAVVPGVAIAVLFGIMLFGWAKLRPQDAPSTRGMDITWAYRWRSLTGLIPIAVIVLIVIGGMYAGIYTATEAAAFGAIAAFVISWVMAGKGNRGPRKTFNFLWRTAMESVISVSAIFLLLIGVAVLTRIMALSGLARVLSDAIVGAGLDRVGVLLVLVLVYLLLGMFLDPLAMILLTVPILQTSLVTLGVDMTWFGVFIVILAEVAIVTPPVGMLIYIVHRLAQDPDVNGGTPVPLTAVFRGVLPFIGVLLLFLVVFILFPEIALWLPSLGAQQ